MNHLKTHKNFINESYNTYYLETHVDGQQQLGSDMTAVLRENFPSKRKLQREVAMQVQSLVNSKKNIHTGLNTAKSIVLKLTDRQHKVYKEFDVTKDVQEKEG